MHFIEKFQSSQRLRKTKCQDIDMISKTWHYIKMSSNAKSKWNYKIVVAFRFFDLIFIEKDTNRNSMND